MDEQYPKRCTFKAQSILLCSQKAPNLKPDQISLNHELALKELAGLVRWNGIDIVHVMQNHE